MNIFETVCFIGRSHGSMTPLCPVCQEPMKQHGRTFQCAPCRQIIAFFEVSDASPYILGGAVRDQPNKEISGS
jgi:tRNA(Ile2) C34 agmatinyltransferase TiaS